MYYPSSWDRPTEGITYTTSSPTISTDTTKWTTTTDVSWGTFTVPSVEYILEDEVLKWKDEVTEEWYKLDEEPDPFASKPKKTVKARVKIKLDKKLGVDLEKVADMLF